MWIKLGLKPSYIHTYIYIILEGLIFSKIMIEKLGVGSRNVDQSIQSAF